MFASLMLARAGHEVLLLERESLEAAPDVEAAASGAFRTGAPQNYAAAHHHGRCRELLIEHLPDVYENLLAAGVAEAPLWTQMAPSMARPDAPARGRALYAADVKAVDDRLGSAKDGRRGAWSHGAKRYAGDGPAGEVRQSAAGDRRAPPRGETLPGRWPPTWWSTRPDAGRRLTCG